MLNEHHNYRAGIFHGNCKTDGYEGTNVIIIIIVVVIYYGCQCSQWLRKNLRQLPKANSGNHCCFLNNKSKNNMAGRIVFFCYFRRQYAFKKLSSLIMIFLSTPVLMSYAKSKGTVPGTNCRVSLTLSLNQAAREPGYEPPYAIHLFLSVMPYESRAKTTKAAKSAKLLTKKN